MNNIFVLKVYMFIILGVLLGGFVLMGSGMVMAEEKGMVVSPAFQEVEILAGESQKSFEVKVENNTDQTQVIRLSVYDFGQLHESGGMAFLGDEVSELDRRYGLASWVTLSNDLMVVDPHSEAVITATINNRESLSPGGHYAAIIGRLEKDEHMDSGNEGNISVQMMFSSLIFAKKTGGERYNLEIDDIMTSWLSFKTPSEVKLRWHNSGNVYAVPRGVVTVENWKGEVIGRGTINQGSLLVLPESMRIMPVKIKPLSQSFLPGLYRLNIQFRYDGREEFTTISKTYLFIGPYATGLIVLIIIFSLYIRPFRLWK